MSAAASAAQKDTTKTGKTCLEIKGASKELRCVLTSDKWKKIEMNAFRIKEVLRAKRFDSQDLASFLEAPAMKTVSSRCKTSVTKCDRDFFSGCTFVLCPNTHRFRFSDSSHSLIGF